MPALWAIVTWEPLREKRHWIAGALLGSKAGFRFCSRIHTIGIEILFKVNLSKYLVTFSWDFRYLKDQDFLNSIFAIETMSDIFSFLVTPKTVEAKSSPFHLKTRLKWGEPALTILDLRTREAFNHSRIRGAISMPLNELMNQPLGLELERDIYLYGESQEDVAQALEKLRAEGYTHVSELNGGLTAWRVADGAIEGDLAA